MKLTLRNTIFLAGVVLIACGLQGAAAQIEIGSDGHVGIGTSPPTGYTLRVDDVQGSGDRRGIYGRTEQGDRAYGVFGQTENPSNNGYGVYGRAVGGANANLAITGYGDGGNTAYGAYLYTGSASTEYGVYASSSGYAGYFSGDVVYTGSLTSSSDRKFKTNVESLGGGDVGAQRTGASGVLQRVLKLRPSTYEYASDDAYAHMNFPEGRQYGLVAQEVEDVFPDLVHEARQPGAPAVNDAGVLTGEGEATRFKSVDYVQLIPVLIQAVQEQQATIERQQAQIDALKEALGDR